MGDIRTAANAAFRDLTTPGVPASGRHDPEKAAIRDAFGVVEDAVSDVAATASAGLVGGYTALSALNADLAHPAGTLAKVGGDGANDGVYRKSGASGVGSWALFDDPVIAASEDAVAAGEAATASAAVVIEATATLSPPRVGFIGDSIVNQNATGGSGYIFTNPQGEAAWAAAMFPYFEWDVWFDGGEANFRNGMIFGYAGETAPDILGHIDVALDTAPDILAIVAGTNGLGNGNSAATEFAALQAMCERAREFGIRPILATVRPRADAGWSVGSAKFIQKQALNVLIRDYCASGGAALWDVASAYDDGTGMPIAGLLPDNIHPGFLGAFLGGRSLVPVLKRMIKPTLKDQPRTTNRLTNPSMSTPGGGAGGNVSGSVGLDWTATCTNGTAVAAISDGVQTFAVNPDNGGSGYALLQISRAFGGVAVTGGEWIRLYADIRLSDWVGWHLFEAIVNDSDSGAQAFPYEASSAQILDLDGDDLILRVQTAPMQVGGGETTVAVLFRCWTDRNASGTGTLTIERLGLGAVPDPRPLHNT